MHYTTKNVSTLKFHYDNTLLMKHTTNRTTPRIKTSTAPFQDPRLVFSPYPVSSTSFFMFRQNLPPQQAGGYRQVSVSPRKLRLVAKYQRSLSASALDIFILPCLIYQLLSFILRLDLTPQEAGDYRSGSVPWGSYASQWNVGSPFLKPPPGIFMLPCFTHQLLFHASSGSFELVIQLQ